MMSISKTDRALHRILPPDEWLIVQGTVTLDDLTALDPDFAWFDCPIGTPNPVRGLPMLLIEVSHTTYRRDAGKKMRKYAQAGIRDYWIVNIKAMRVEVFRDPRNPTGKRDDCYYADVSPLMPGASIPLLARPAVSLAVNDLLP
jgi:Uma2 family endonuclease